ncbi:MAG: DUF2066 domain-containing protein [Gammaproteobacteria bacterium]
MNSGFGQTSVMILVVLLLGVWTAGQAREIPDLYEAKVPVVGQGEAERHAAIRTALSEVLVKVSGQQSVIDNAALKATLKRSLRFVQQFRYEALEQESSPQEELAVESEYLETVDLMVDQTQEMIEELPKVEEPVIEYTQLLWVSFDSEAINRELRKASLPIWGRARPATLVWIAIEDDGNRFLLGGDVRPGIQNSINETGRHRGVPLLLPLLDLEDRARLRFTDVWGNFQETILSASERYQTEAVLVGRLYRKFDNNWQARWSLYENEGVRHWNDEDPDQENLLKSGIDMTSDMLALRYAKVVRENGDGGVELTVSRVNTLEDYARAMKYLDALDLVTDLKVSNVQSGQVKFRLAIRGDEQSLVETIGYGDTLAATIKTENQQSMGKPGVEEQGLHYRLLQ